MSLLIEPESAQRAARSNWTRWLPVAGSLVVAGWASNQFPPMLLIYSRDLALTHGTLGALFAVTILGLVPSLLFGAPLALRYGRHRVLGAAVGISLVASAVTAVAGDHVALLFAGRLLSGVSNGAIFGAATGWLRELSQPPFDDRGEQGAARRAVVAMTTGFAVGPLVAGLLAAWAPAGHVEPFAPHIALSALVLATLHRAPAGAATGGRVRLFPPALRDRRFRWVVAPMAPWVFAAPAIAFALLPTLVDAARAREGVALVAAVTAVCAIAGVAAQPFARRLDARRAGANLAGGAGLLVLAAGLALGAVTAATESLWLLAPAAIVLGAAYGMCQVAGLTEVQRIGDPESIAGLTGVYYVLAYTGLTAPYVVALAAHAASYPLLLGAAAGLALLTAAVVSAGARTTTG